MEGTCNSAHLN